MTLVETITLWQQEALKIAPPSGSDRLPAVGGLSGPAFFPEGFGLSDPLNPLDDRPAIMAIGHNFGCENYRKNLESPGPGREDIDGKGTWRKLDGLLRNAGASPANCYRTNWFIGLLPGKKNTGPFLLNRDPDYEDRCSSLLRKQISFLRPKTILLLGPEVIRRAYQIFPVLEPWRHSKKFNDVDQSSVGHSLRNIEIQGASSQTNIAAHLHPSLGAPNQGRRMKNMSKPMTEVEIIQAVLTAL